jgi:hypothetical protein
MVWLIWDTVQTELHPTAELGEGILPKQNMEASKPFPGRRKATGFV